jgi:hypothetical protein
MQPLQQLKRLIPSEDGVQKHFVSTIRKSVLYRVAYKVVAAWELLHSYEQW